MTLIGDCIALYQREMLLFRANIRVNLIRATIFPLVIIVLFGNLGNVISNVDVIVVNYANNAASQQFVSSLQLQQDMSVVQQTDQASAMAQLAAGDVSFVVVILPNFPSTGTTPSVQVYYSNTQFTVTSFILPLIAERASEFTAPTSFQSKFYQPSTVASSTVLTTPINGATGSYKTFLFSGIIGMVLVFSCLFAGGISLITDRLGGNIKAFLVTPINSTAILISRVMSGCVQSIVYVVVVLLIGFINGSTVAMGIPGIILIFMLGFTLTAGFTSVAAIIAGRIKNIQAYAIVSQAVGMPLWLLSGGIFPISSLPSWLQPIAIINPMSYATNGFRYIVLQGTYPIGAMITDFVVLILFAVIATFASIKLFKTTID